tara:strand:+ start:3053 stop:3247 length:195 start_codon:yes stop_codon:yes gene_type:complete
MSDLYMYEKMLKNVRERQNVVKDALCFGPVPDFTAFKELRARLGELAITEQDLKDLLEKVTDDD